jgi:hypothetical protein
VSVSDVPVEHPANEAIKRPNTPLPCQLTDRLSQQIGPLKTQDLQYGSVAGLPQAAKLRPPGLPSRSIPRPANTMRLIKSTAFFKADSADIDEGGLLGGRQPVSLRNLSRFLRTNLPAV